MEPQCLDRLKGQHHGHGVGERVDLFGGKRVEVGAEMGAGLATEPRPVEREVVHQDVAAQSVHSPNASDRRHPLVEVEPVVDELLDSPRQIACGLIVELKKGREHRVMAFDGDAIQLFEILEVAKDTAMRDARAIGDLVERWRDVAFLVQRQDGVDHRLPVAVATSAAPVDAGEFSRAHRCPGAM